MNLQNFEGFFDEEILKRGFEYCMKNQNDMLFFKMFSQIYITISLGECMLTFWFMKNWFLRNGGYREYKRIARDLMDLHEWRKSCDYEVSNHEIDFTSLADSGISTAESIIARCLYHNTVMK